MSGKSDVIRCLMIVGSGRRTTTTISKTADDIGLRWGNYLVAIRACNIVIRETSQNYYVACLEAAYRMIEKDETLRRQWFGS